MYVDIYIYTYIHIYIYLHPFVHIQPVSDLFPKLTLVHIVNSLKKLQDQPKLLTS